MRCHTHALLSPFVQGATCGARAARRPRCPSNSSARAAAARASASPQPARPRAWSLGRWPPTAQRCAGGRGRWGPSTRTGRSAGAWRSRARWRGAGRRWRGARWRRTSRAPSPSTCAPSPRSLCAPRVCLGAVCDGRRMCACSTPTCLAMVGARMQAHDAATQTVAELRSEMTEARSENAALRADNAALRSEVATLRGELSALREDHSSQRDDNMALRSEVAELRRTVQELLAAGGAAMGGHPPVAGHAGARDQIGAAGGAAAPVSPPVPLFTATQQDSASAYYCSCDNNQNRQANDHASGGLQLSLTSAASARPPASPPQPPLSTPAANRAAAPPPPPATPTVPQGDGRACALTGARGQRVRVYAHARSDLGCLCVAPLCLSLLRWAGWQWRAPSGCPLSSRRWPQCTRARR